MHEIMIISCRYDYDVDAYLTQQSSGWVMVSDEDLEFLNKNIHLLNREYRIVERMPVLGVDGILAQTRKALDDIEKKKAEMKAKAAAKAAATAEKNRAAKIRRLEKLKRELGEI